MTSNITEMILPPAKFRKFYSITTLVILCTALVVFLSFIPISSPLAAKKITGCSSINSRNSVIFLIFKEFVQENYYTELPYQMLFDTSRNLGLSYGHALRRLDLAVKGDPYRSLLVKCVVKGIDRSMSVFTAVSSSVVSYGIVQETFRGIHDLEVSRVFGVTDKSPAEIVFLIAERIEENRSPKGPTKPKAPTPRFNPPPPTTKLPGNTVTTGLFPPSPAIKGVPKECMKGDRWTLSDAAKHFGAAERLATTLAGSGNCSGANFSICRNIKEELWLARDHIHNVFEQNFDGSRNCRLCNYGTVLKYANALRNWVDWSKGRGMYIGANINTYYIIDERKALPLCSASSPSETIRSTGPLVIAGGRYVGGFGTVILSGGHSASGTYSSTFDKNKLGRISFSYNPATGNYTGKWSEPAVGRIGVLENIVISNGGKTIRASWHVTVPGNLDGKKLRMGRGRATFSWKGKS